MLIDLLPALASAYQVGAIVPGDGALSPGLAIGRRRNLSHGDGRLPLIKKGRADLLRFAVETPRLALIARRLIRSFNADIVYANNSRTLVWGTLAAALAHRPVLWHIHNLFDDRKTLQLLQRLSRWRTVRRILCASTQAADQFADTPVAKLRMIPSGVDLKHSRRHRKPAIGPASPIQSEQRYHSSAWSAI